VDADGPAGSASNSCPHPFLRTKIFVICLDRTNAPTDLPTQDWVAKKADGLSRAGWASIRLSGTKTFDDHIEIGLHALVAVGRPEAVVAVGCLAWVSILWETGSQLIAKSQSCRMHA
jgi:hypothetical protein